MFIKSLKLQNFKRHALGEWTFYPGTNAICGPNGAGKSSLVEAIGLALFNYQPYRNRAELIRKGEKKALIRVVFQAVDDRLYIVERKLSATSSQVTIYDHETEQVLAEKNDACTALLSTLMELDESLEPKHLFRTLLGVSQGTLTAAFLEGVRERKAIFYPLLQVDEYTKAHKEMRPQFLGPLGLKARDLETRLSFLEESLEALPGIELELADAEQQHKEMKEAETFLQQTLPKKKEQLKAQQEEKQRLEQHQKQHASLQEKAQAQQTALGRAQQEFEEAVEAQTILDALKEPHAQHLEARTQQESLQKQQKEAQSLQQELHRLAGEHTGLRAKADQKKETLARLKELEEKHEALAPKIARQEQLEARLEGLQRQQLQWEERTQEQTRLEKALAEDEQAVSQKQVLVQELEALQPALAQQEEIKEEGTRLKGEIGDAQNQQKRREELLTEQTQKQQALEQREQEIAEHVSLLRKLRGEVGGQQEAVDEARKTVEKTQTEILRLETQIEREQNFEREISGGICPFFQARCLNLPEGENLETYIGKRLGEAEPKLKALRQTLPTHEKEAKARQIALEKLRTQISECTAQRDEKQKALKHAQQEYEQLSEKLKQHPDQHKRIAEMEARRQELRTAFKRLNEDAKRAAMFGVEQQSLQRLQRELQQRKDRHQEVVKECKELAGAAAEIPPLEQELKALEQPRQQAMVLAQELKGRQKVERELKTLKQSVKESRAAQDELKAKLKDFVDVEEALAQARATLEATQEDYTKFLQHQKPAEKKDAAKERLEQTKTTLTALEEERDAVMALIEPLQQSVDPKALLALEEEVHELELEQTRLEVSLPAMRKGVERLTAERDKLRQSQLESQEGLQTLAHLREVLDCSEMVRQMYQEAGPRVTAALIASISRDANRLFRELMDHERSMHLAWTEDFQILIEEDGQERSFANLSGGEQMSAALAVRLALVRELSNVRIAFFDEPTAHMDKIRRFNLSSRLMDIEGFDQLFVISHDDTFEAITDHVVWVGADPNLSLRASA